MLASVLMTLDACLDLISNSPAIALTRAPLVMAFLPELAFMACLVFGGSILVTLRETPVMTRRGWEVARLSRDA